MSTPEKPQDQPIAKSDGFEIVAHFEAAADSGVYDVFRAVLPAIPRLSDETQSKILRQALGVADKSKERRLGSNQVGRRGGKTRLHNKRGLRTAGPEIDASEEIDIAEYLQDIIMPEPEKRQAALMDLDKKADSLRKFYFDDHQAQRKIDDAQALLRWLVDDTRGQTPPAVFRMHPPQGTITVDNEPNRLFGELSSTVCDLFAPTKPEFSSQPSFEKQLKAHLTATPTYQFLASFNDRHDGERPLSITERSIKEQQALGQVAIGTGVPLTEIIYPYSAAAEDPLAGVAHMQLQKHRARIDMMTVNDERSDHSQSAMDRFRDYFKGYIRTYANDETSLQFELLKLQRTKNCTGLIQFCEHISGSKYTTPENTFLLNFIARAMADGRSDNNDLSKMLEGAVDDAVMRINANVRYTWTATKDLCIPPDYWWLVKEPYLDEEWENKQAARSAQKYNLQLPADPPSMKSGYELQESEQFSLGQVIFDADENLFDGTGPAKRLVTTALASVHQPKLPDDTLPSLRLAYNTSFAQLHFGDERQPYIVGYTLLGQAPVGDTIEYDFARLPGDTSYEACHSTIPEAKKTLIIEYLEGTGLTCLRDALADESELTIEKLRKTIVNESRYYIPQTTSNEVMIVKEGRANFQCVGAAELAKTLLNIVSPDSTRTVSGNTIPLNGKITLVGHCNVVYREGQKQYVLDAQPKMGQPDQLSSNAVRHNAVPQPQKAHTQPEVQAEPDSADKEADPRQKLEQTLKSSVDGLYKTRDTFEQASRVYFGLETAEADQSVDALYRKILGSTTEADPLRQTWRHISYAIPHSLSTPIHEADVGLLETHLAEADQLIVQFQNIKAIPEGERQVFGKSARNSNLTTFIAMLTSAKRNYQRMITARQALTDMT